VLDLLRQKMGPAVLVLVVAVSAALAGCAGPGPEEAATTPKETGSEAGGEEAPTETGPGAEEAKPVSSGLLTVAHTATVTTWDPSAAFSTECTYLTNIYEPLLWANPPGSDEPFRPALAESWTVSDDGLVWTFNLREGVKFHDGETLTADAVKKSIERTIEMATGASFIWGPVDSIEAVDDYTVRFTLKYPVPLDRIVSSGNGAWIMSPRAAERDREWFDQGHEAGTGPWLLKEHRPGEQIVLERFDDYWGGWDGAHFDTVVVKIVGEAVVQRQMLEGGEADIASVVPVESVEALRARDDIKVPTHTSFYNYLGFLNTKRPPLDDVRVRRAVSYAIPYEDIIEVAASGYATQARGPVPTGLWPWDESLPQYSYDPDRAQELLAEAGYPDGGFELVLTYTSENPAEERFAPLIKEALEEIGIGVEVRPLLWNQQWALAKQDPEEAQDIFCLLWWPTYADGYDNLHSMFTTEEKPLWNLAYWYNERFDELLDRAYRLSGPDRETSKELYLEAQTLLIEEAPAIFFYDVQEIVPMRADLKGFVPNPCYPRVIFFYDLYR